MIGQAKRPQLELIVTASCSRCDEALDWLLSMPELRGLALRSREVMADDALYETYAERVPVLCLAGRELDWPFDREELKRLLSADAPQRARLAQP